MPRFGRGEVKSRAGPVRAAPYQRGTREKGGVVARQIRDTNNDLGTRVRTRAVPGMEQKIKNRYETGGYSQHGNRPTGVGRKNLLGVGNDSSKTMQNAVDASIR